MAHRKKMTIGIMAALILLLTLPLVSGCGPAPGEAPKDWPTDVVCGGGPNPNSSYYLMGSFFADQLRKEYGIRVTPVNGPSEEFIIAISEGRMQFSNITGPIGVWAAEGKETFANKGPLPIRLIAGGSDMTYNFMTKKASGIKTIEDMRGKKIAADYKGVDYVLWMVKEVLAIHGVSEKDVTFVPYSASQEGGKQLVDGIVDVAFASGPVPQAWMTELSQMNELYFIPMPKETAQKVAAKYPWWIPYTLKAGSYRGVDQDTPSIKVTLYWAGHTDLPDSFVYQLLTYAFDPKYRADFEKVHSTVPTQHTLERAIVSPGLAFHAGAVKFYKDFDVWTKELDEWQKNKLKEYGQKR